MTPLLGMLSKVRLPEVLETGCQILEPSSTNNGCFFSESVIAFIIRKYNTCLNYCVSPMKKEKPQNRKYAIIVAIVLFFPEPFYPIEHLLYLGKREFEKSLWVIDHW